MPNSKLKSQNSTNNSQKNNPKTSNKDNPMLLYKLKSINLLLIKLSLRNFNFILINSIKNLSWKTNKWKKPYSICKTWKPHWHNYNNPFKPINPMLMKKANKMMSYLSNLKKNKLKLTNWRALCKLWKFKYKS